MHNQDLVNEKITSGYHHSVWTDTQRKLLIYPPLALNISVDVVIVGGGIAGVTTAYCLSKAGKRVALVEDGYIGSGETGRTSAQLASALDDGFVNLERTFGEEKLKLIIGAHQKAVDFIEQTIKTENIDCEFARVNAYLFQHERDHRTSLKDEKEAAVKGGLKAHLLDYTPGLNDPKKACIMFEEQGQFHPLHYLAGLCEAIRKEGGQIFTETHAKDISGKGIVTNEGYSIDAQHVIVATNTPVNDKYSIHLKQTPYRTYIIGCRIKKNSVPQAIWWDTGDHEKEMNVPPYPYHYVRVVSLDTENDLLICGGKDHPVGMAEAEQLPEEKRYDPLFEWAQRHFPVEEVIYKWSGEVMEPMDSVAFIGRNPHDTDNVYICTGDSGNGLTHATLAAQLLTDLVLGKENSLEKIYNPSRFHLFRAAKTVMQEVTSGISEYFKHKPDYEHLETIQKLNMDEATVVTIEKKKYGIYKDHDRILHMVSATCTHLGCTVKWNNDEKSWDCSCHGSRFTCTGKILEGPANVPLPYKMIDEDHPLDDVNEEAAE